MTKWLNFTPLAEFTDRSGIVRSICGCSLVGRFEFIDRQESIKAILDSVSDDETWQQLYLSNTQFRTSVDRCLLLNGLDPDWLTPEQIEQLLFARLDDDIWKSGWLTELNARESKPSSGETIESTLPNLLAYVSLACESLSEAIDLATNMPGNLLLDTIEARCEMLKTPDQKAADEQSRNMAALKADYSKLVK
jgi:hypothetical protein